MSLLSRCFRMRLVATSPARVALRQRPDVATYKPFSTSVTSPTPTFEPDYLDSAGPVIPTYPPLNIQMRGYNFDLLESFQSYVHNLAENMGVDVHDAWVTPPRTFKICTFFEEGTRVRDEHNLNLYERNVQVVGLSLSTRPFCLTISELVFRKDCCCLSMSTSR